MTLTRLGGAAGVSMSAFDWLTMQFLQPSVFLSNPRLSHTGPYLEIIRSARSSGVLDAHPANSVRTMR